MEGVYTHPAYTTLLADIRSDLAPVVEGVRTGVNIELWKLKRESEELFAQQQSALEDVLEFSHMPYVNPENNYYATFDADWLQQLCEGYINPGEFLDTPACCIENFTTGCQLYLAGMSSGPAAEFWRDAAEAIDEGHFNENFFYVTHVPCGIECTESLQLGSRIREALERVDPEAAAHRRDYNKRLLEEFGGVSYRD